MNAKNQLKKKKTYNLIFSLHFISIWSVNLLQIQDPLPKSNCFSHIIVPNKHLPLSITLEIQQTCYKMQKSTINFLRNNKYAIKGENLKQNDINFLQMEMQEFLKLSL